MDPCPTPPTITNRDDRPLKVNPTGLYCVVPADLAAAEARHHSLMAPSTKSPQKMTPLLSPLSNIPLNNGLHTKKAALSESAQCDGSKDVLMAAAAALVPCADCGRRFASARIAAHQRICHKVNVGAKRRGVFNAQERRQQLIADVNTDAKEEEPVISDQTPTTATDVPHTSAAQ